MLICSGFEKELHNVILLAEGKSVSVKANSKTW